MAKREITPPQWLTVSYIEKAMQQGLKDPNLKIKSCDISPATAVGDNYGSIMLRVRLVVQKNGKEEETFVIVKIPPETSLMENNKVIAIFRREIEMLTKTLPALNDILRNVYPEEESLCAFWYYQEQDPDKITCIFMEDLRRLGFTVADRFGGLDRDHTSLVLRSLAKFHASSLLHVDQDPKVVSLYDVSFYSLVGPDILKPTYEKPVKVIAKSIEKWENFPKKDVYLKKMKDLEGKIVDKFLQTFVRDDNKLNLICHGDCWVNNMMFRYDEKNKVNGIRFLDFQASHYNSPVFDLMYFIFSSTQTRFSEVDSLLSVYHETFVTTLESLKYELKKPFTLEVLKKEFREKLFFGLATVLAVLPIITVPSSKTAKLDDIFDKDSSESDRIYDREEFMDILKVALPYFEENGVF